MTKEKKSY